jgi:phosphoribosylformimino-5-aminoimidazole carboxamide ribotide isomerase
VSARKGSAFQVIPAVDLRAGRVVRLEEGDFNRERIYADDPTEVAHGFATAGARWIHVVDLNGARTGERMSPEKIAAIRGAIPARVRLQVGGGIRSAGAIAEILASGARRIVLGTSALENPDMVQAAITEHGEERIAVALDVRDGRAVGHGWVQGEGGSPVDEAVEKMESRGVSTFIVTAIDRDGLLRGPDLQLLERLVRRTRTDVIASGGIATIDDLQATRAIGCRGAIVGRALYDGSLDLAVALAAVD